MRTSRRLGVSDGQGTFALVVVIVLFTGLVAAAVPGYIRFQDRRAEKVAKAQLLTAVWTAEAYRQDHGSYAGMDAADLLKIDPRVPHSLAVTIAQRHKYCLADSVNGRTFSILGPYRGTPRFTANAECTEGRT